MTTIPVSAANDAIIAFAELLRAQSALTGVTVFEEPQRPDLYGTEFVVVCMTVSSDQGDEQLGAGMMREEFTLSGILETTYAGAGEADTRALRQRAYEILGGIKTLLRTKNATNPELSGIRLGGTVNWARLARYEYTPGTNADVRVGRITFDVDCVAELRPS